MVRYITLLCFIFAYIFSHAQYATDICNTYGVNGCINGVGTGDYKVITSLDKNGGLYTTPGNSMPFWVSAYYSDQQVIDTSFSSSVYFEVINGPGTLNGTTYYSNIQGYKYIDDWKFSVAGDYEVEMRIQGIVIDTIDIKIASKEDLCLSAPSGGCQLYGGNSIFTLRSSIVSVDAVYPITVGLVDVTTGLVDQGWEGTSQLKLISGSGEMFGATYLYATDWASFVDIRFNTAGEYEIQVEIDGNRGLHKDTIIVEVGDNVSSIQQYQRNEMKVYPNPTTNFLNFNVKNDQTTLRILSLDGREFFRKENVSKGNFSLPLKDLAVGNYILFVGSMFTLPSEKVFTKIK